MDALVSLFALALQPRLALRTAFCVALALVFGLWFPGANGIQAIMLASVGIGLCVLLEALRSEAANPEAQQTPSTVFIAGAVLLGAAWGASSYGSSSSFLVGLAVQAAASWVWLRSSATQASGKAPGLPVLTAVVSAVAFLLGVVAAAVAA